MKKLFSRSSFAFLAAAVFVMCGFLIATTANATITSLNLTAPVGTEEWRGSQNITWDATTIPGGTDTISIVLSTDSGANYNKLIATGVDATTGSYSWNTNATAVGALADGSTYRIKITDGLTGVDFSSTDFMVDNTDPVTTATLNPAAPDGENGWYVTTPTITLTCDDGAGSGCASTYYKWDDGLYSLYTGTFDALEGDHTLSFYSQDTAVDAAGGHNVGVALPQQIKVDTVHPTFNASSTTSNGSYNEGDNINVTLTFSEPVFSDALKVWLDTDLPLVPAYCITPAFSNATTNSCTYIVSAGHNTADLTVSPFVAALSGIIKDVAGNESTPNLPYTPISNIADTSDIVIDTTAPIAFTTGAVATTGGNVVAGWWNSTNTGIDVSVPVDNDNSLVGGTIQLQAEANGTFENIGLAYTILLSDIATTKMLSLTAADVEALTGFAEGEVLAFRAIITDLAANSTTGLESVNTLEVDQVLPTVNAGTDKEVNAVVTQDAQTSDDNSGIAGWQWTGAGIIFSSATTEDTDISSATDGTYTATLTVMDLAGNTNSDTMQLAWDTTKPGLAQVTPVKTPTNDTTPSYVFSVDSVKQLLASVGGTINYAGACGLGDLAAALVGNNTVTYGPLTDGIYSGCTITVTDAAGNISDALTVNDFEIDTIAATVLGIKTYDVNEDGRVDKAEITFDDKIDDSTFNPSQFTIGGVAADGFSSGATPNDGVIEISLSAGVDGTEAKTVVYTAGSATDLAGNAIASFSQLSTDLAGPVMLSAITKSITTIETTWSEDLDGTTVNSDGGEFTVAGYAVSAADETAPGVVTLTVATMPTDATPLVTFTSTYFNDLNGNTAPAPQSVAAADGIAPVLTAVSIASDNTNPIYAMEGNTITVTFTASETIKTPTVAIQGVPASVVNVSGNTWAASRVMAESDTQGNVSFTISFEDLPGNVGATVTAVTDTSSVFFDSVNPSVNAGTDKEVNAVATQDATVSDTAPSSGGLVYQWTNETPLVGTITFGSPTAEDTTISADRDGIYTISLTVRDNAGNQTTDTITFIWDTVNPEPLTSTPSDGTVSVFIAAGTAKVTFDEDIVLLDASRVLLVNDVTGDSYSGTISVEGGNGASAILNITYSGLAYGTKYRINVKPNAISDVATNKLTSNFISYFTTEADTIVPVVNSANATAITTTGATLNVATNESAICRYAIIDSAYSAMTPFTTTGATSHNIVLTGLSSSTGYDYYVRCADASGNEMTTSAHVSFTTLTPEPVAPAVPVITTFSTIIDADNYTLAGTVATNGASRIITIYNGTTVVGTTTVPAEIASWSLIVPLDQDTDNVFSATASDLSGNTSAASSTVTITEMTDTGDTDAPDAPAITTSAATVDAGTYTIEGTAGVDYPDPTTQTITIYNNGTVMGSVILAVGETNWSFVASLYQNTDNVFTAYSTDPSGNTSAASEPITIIEREETATLAVTGISAVKTFATANGTYENGWSWIFKVTVPIGENLVKMKFNDWTESTGTTPIAAQENIRYSSAQSTTPAVTITGAGVYGSTLELSGTDLDESVPGLQIEILVEARVPAGSEGGSYTTSYGIYSEASGT